MCGIAGFWDSTTRQQASDFDRTAVAMAKALHHRGPDDSGVWSEPQEGVALAHQRLSIIDPSAAGHQPMMSADRRFVTTYNGEIYNATELRIELEASGRVFKGHSDTEVLVEACAAWGIEKTVTRLIGMFAFAVWDRQHRALTLVRDRLGIKPLYWARFGSLILFGSELKALRQHPGWQASIDRDALAAYTRYARIPTPYSIYKGVFALRPAHLLRLRADDHPQPQCYWDLSSLALRGASEARSLTEPEAEEELYRLLTDSVRRRMVADVPVGAFLSGGIDSSCMVALMQTSQAQPIKTFSIGFDNSAFDEAPFARQIAAHLATDHTQLHMRPEDVLKTIHELPRYLDEPFADSSQIPTYLVSRLARQHVKVAVSGDGGDEIFGGYHHYRQLGKKWQMLGHIPQSIRIKLSSLLDKCPEWIANEVLGRMMHGVSRPRQRLIYLAEYLQGNDAHDFYRAHYSQFFDPGSLVLDSDEQRVYEGPYKTVEALPEFQDRMQLLDLLTYLPDDVLTKVDRCSMSMGLEVRVPLLDHRIVEFSWSLPQHFRAGYAEPKWLLRRLLNRHVPNHLFDRRKQGFSVPVADWIRNELRPWAEDLLEADRLHRQGYYNATLVQDIWRQHQSGHFDWHGMLWSILMFQLWLEEWEIPAARA